MTTTRFAYCCAIPALIIGAGSVLQYFNISRVVLNLFYVGSVIFIFMLNCYSVTVRFLSGNILSNNNANSLHLDNW
jgi:amino acid permease